MSRLFVASLPAATACENGGYPRDLNKTKAEIVIRDDSKERIFNNMYRS